MSNRDKVREQIAVHLCAHDSEMLVANAKERELVKLVWAKLKDTTKESYLKEADQILAIDNLLIKADDQNLPVNTENDIPNISPRRVCADSQTDMLKAGFVRIEK